MTNTITFNTGRHYSEHGQRIAAQRLDCGHIILVDIDRHIDYIFTDLTPFTQRGIMLDYDNNVTITPDAAGISYDDYYVVVNQLRAAAGAVKSI
jgi:hypothetical protein